MSCSQAAISSGWWLLQVSDSIWFPKGIDRLVQELPRLLCFQEFVFSCVLLLPC